MNEEEVGERLLLPVRGDRTMTEPIQTTSTQTAPSLPRVSPTWEEQRRKRDTLAAEAFETNKQTLFAALSAAGITEIIIEFDGEGDSGQIDHVQASDANGTVALPDERIEVASAPWEGDELSHVDETLGGAIETVCYALLSANCGGWEINEGSYGMFVFDVAERTIELTHNERYVSVETSEHTF